jgi:cytochrome c-type biogenesis protein CcsB
MIRRLARSFVITCAAGLLGSVLGAEASHAALPDEALRLVRTIAVQHNGRHKPFDSFARETLQHITGEPRLGGEDPVETLVSILASPEPWQAKPLLSIPFGPLREPLGMEPKARRISYSDLVASRKLMRMLPPIVQKQQRDEKLTMLEQETMDAFDRFVAFSRLVDQQLELVPPPGAPGKSWLPVTEIAGYPEARRQAMRSAWDGFLSSVRRGGAGAITASAGQLREALRSANPSAYPAPWRLELEVFYNHAMPFRIAQLFYALAALGLVVSLVQTRARRAPVVGSAALWAGFALHAGGIALRVVLGGRPPVSNFYETTLWLPFVGVLIALIFERVYRVRYFGAAAAILALITLVLSERLPLDPSISPVVAVLRSNLWLTIHVLTIVASYGALALATVMAHVYGVVSVARPGSSRTLAPLDLFLYRAIQVGVVLLAGGIMLGAVWANASWGRYWGWDPKETWALITLLWFLAILHGRFAGWLRGIGVALGTISGFFLLLMTYYGVSFYLVGLHSYAGGHAKPLPPLLIGYVIAELAFMGWVGAAGLRHARD